jgi:hypothetical protein
MSLAYLIVIGRIVTPHLRGPQLPAVSQPGQIVPQNLPGHWPAPALGAKLTRALRVTRGEGGVTYDEREAHAWT